MATKKVKTTKEITSLPSESAKSITKNETEKKPLVKKTTAKPAEVEATKTKKSPVKKEKLLTPESIVTPAANEILEPELTATKSLDNDETEAVPVVAKVEEVVKEIKKKVSKPINKIIEAVDTIIHPDTANKEEIQALAEDTKPEVGNQKTLKAIFQLKYSTAFGQRLFITGDHEVFGSGDIQRAIALQYFNNEYWFAEVEVPVTNENISYSYFLVNEYAQVVHEKKQDKVLNPLLIKGNNVLIADTWNQVDYAENNLFAEPNIDNARSEKDQIAIQENATHLFKVKAPGLPKEYKVFITGSSEELGNWSEENLRFLTRNEGATSFTIGLNLSNVQFPLVYKYGVYNSNDNSVVQIESGDNRVFYPVTDAKLFTIVADGLVYLSDELSKIAV